MAVRQVQKLLQPVRRLEYSRIVAVAAYNLKADRKPALGEAAVTVEQF